MVYARISLEQYQTQVPRHCIRQPQFPGYSMGYAKILARAV